MIPSDLDLARLCAASELNPTGFDFIDDGTETGVWVGIKRIGDTDVIVFRGSITPEDWWRDAHTEMISIPGLGLVHSGFIKNLDIVHSKLDAITRPNPIITGHSLGAARAALYAGMLVNYYDDPKEVVLFGCPRPGAQTLTNLLKNVPIISYRNRLDPVTDVPLPLPPEFPYEHVRQLTGVDGMVDYSIGPPWDDHHIANYCKGLENDISKAST